MEKKELYLWLCVCAVVLGLIWYISEFGYILVQAGFCALCFIVKSENNSKVCENSTQTDSDGGEAASQQESETHPRVGSDEPDITVRTVQKESCQSQYPNIQRSLQHLFKCAYTHLVLPWSTDPEHGESQPLYTALLTEFNFVVDEIICKAKNMDLSITALGCIQIFTQHFQNTKQSEGSPAFGSKAEEIAVIRGVCKTLIHNLFPKHLWEPNIYDCALQEILTMKALAFVTLLSDPDNLNHLVISQLDQTSSKKQIKEVPVPHRDIPSSKWSENSDMVQRERDEHLSEEGKVKKKGIRLKFPKVLDIIKGKKVKLKRKKKEVINLAVPSRRPAVIDPDSTSSNEGSIHDSVDTDGESLTYSLQETMKFKLSYEMWKVGNWSVTVINVQMEGNELCFTIHLEEINNPENFHWDVKKNQSDIIQFYNQCKELGHLPSLLTIVEKPKTEWNKEETRESLKRFFQDLVANAELCNSELVFNFLGPVDALHGEGLWVLLEEIASFLTPGQDEDELHNLKMEEKQHEVMYACTISEAKPQQEQDDTQPMCTDTLERQETEDELLEVDGGHLTTPEQTFTCTSKKQHTEDNVHLLDQLEVNPVRIQSVGVNIGQFPAKMKHLKFQQNFKRQASAFSSSANEEDSSIPCTTDVVSVSNYNGNISKEENLPHRKSSETDKTVRQEKESHPEEETLSQPSGDKKMSKPLEHPEANKVIFDLLKEISGNSYTFKFMKAVVTPFTPLINNDF
ncbi:uncharacterized protein si:rp71-46j2.7 isoform X3 [Neoarius graeffei]|uniref:uncharacterized protein si:rp71-46j2.7 isoform X3 n=1 Tax=Neoarius graeffei TaxID=443677 RepID=UPI00298D0868|nr:uncharacterized protein si:rp71-46j2.7 isoform X3 [Neoarius graeffei]